jgi:hypothetical protein
MKLKYRFDKKNTEKLRVWLAQEQRSPSISAAGPRPAQAG